MAEVTHLSSMGIRSLVMGAKAAQLKGATLVLLSPVANVEAVLTAAGIDTLIPIPRPRRGDAGRHRGIVGRAEKRRAGRLTSSSTST